MKTKAKYCVAIALVALAVVLIVFKSGDQSTSVATPAVASDVDTKPAALRAAREKKKGDNTQSMEASGLKVTFE